MHRSRDSKFEKGCYKPRTLDWLDDEDSKENTEYVVTEKHHRRPQSLDGSSEDYNISLVEPKFHPYWHLISGNMNAFQTCDRINVLFPEWEVVCKFINGDPVTKRGGHNCKKKEKCYRAWDILFRGQDFPESIRSINSRWLDPSYHFYVRRKK